MTRQIPGKLGSSPDTSSPARPDVAAAIQNQLPPAPVVKAAAPATGYDRHGLQNGYLESVARAAVRFNRPMGQPGAMAAAAQTADALGLVQKARPAARQSPIDDPTGAQRTLTALRRLYQAGGGTSQPRQPVRKVAAGTMVACYDPKGQLVGAIDAGKLRDVSKAGDEARFNAQGQIIGYAADKDLVPLKAKAGVSGGNQAPAKPQPAAKPQAAASPLAPVQKARGPVTLKDVHDAEERAVLLRSQWRRQGGR